jgi:hypothetical protein
MRGIVFYIKVSRPAIWEELYFTSRLLVHLYERNCILHQGFSPSYMKLWCKIQFLSYSWERNLDVKCNSSHIGGREDLMSNTIPHIKVSRPAIWEELYFTSRLLAQLYERNCISHQGCSPSYMRGIVFYNKVSRPAIWEELYFTSRFLAQLYERNCILHQGFSPKIQFLSYSWARNLDVKYNSSHIAGRETLM